VALARRGLAVLLVGRVTKSGVFAGARDLQHDVDAHAHLSVDAAGMRTLTFQKNRFGPAMRPLSLEMTERGLGLATAKPPQPSPSPATSSPPDFRRARERPWRTGGRADAFLRALVGL
jgi:hypothetical protein